MVQILTYTERAINTIACLGFILLFCVLDTINHETFSLYYYYTVALDKVCVIWQFEICIL